MEALNLSGYPATERWEYKDRTISIHLNPSNEEAIFALSLGLPIDSLNFYYSVLVYDGTVVDNCHMNVPDVEITDYAIRKELIESWIDENLPTLKVSFWKKVLMQFDRKHAAMQGKF